VLTIHAGIELPKSVTFDWVDVEITPLEGTELAWSIKRHLTTPHAELPLLSGAYLINVSRISNDPRPAPGTRLVLDHLQDGAHSTPVQHISRGTGIVFGRIETSFGAGFVMRRELAPSTARAEAPAPTITVLSTGKSPTKPLRFEAKQGAKLTLEIVERSAMSRLANGKPPAPEPTLAFRTTLDADISEVRANGDFRTDVVYRKIEADATRMNPELARGINASLGGVVGMTGHTIVTSRGITKETDLRVPASVTPELRQKIEAFRGLQGQIISPFPDEPVGVGARWDSSLTAEVPDDNGGLIVHQTTSYELVELAGTRGKLAITVKSTASSVDDKLTTSTTGKGEVAFDLAQVGVCSTRSEITTEVKLDDNAVHLRRVSTSTTTLTGRARS
jgi:hypothetical protein